VPAQRLSTGVDLYYESHGRGEPLVLIPATGFAGNVWLPDQVPALAESFQVIVFDPRGCGRSSQPRTVYTIDQMARDTIALLDHLEIEAAHVLGHSMGGRIGLAMALDFPGRVRSLILAASGSGIAAFPAPACVPGLPEQLARAVATMGLEGYVRHEICETSTYFSDGFRAREPERVKAFFRLAWEQHAPLDSYVSLCIARHTWEATHRLGDVRAPTLVVIGDGDVVGRSHVPQADVLAQRIPGAELKVLPGQCHGFFWEVPDETNAWIRDWVSRQADATRAGR
jgi:pimeloyl-ACP methyl ester carboxylesterase